MGVLLLEVLENAVRETSVDAVVKGFDEGSARCKAVGRGE
jgi:hypothetical protein